MAEVSVFPKEEVRQARALYVEARLHSDAHDPVLREQITEMIDSVAKTLAQPAYVVIDTASEEEVNRYEGAPIPPNDPDASKFVEFLETSR